MLKWEALIVTTELQRVKETWWNSMLKIVISDNLWPINLMSDQECKFKTKSHFFVWLFLSMVCYNKHELFWTLFIVSSSFKYNIWLLDLFPSSGIREERFLLSWSRWKELVSITGHQINPRFLYGTSFGVQGLRLAPSGLHGVISQKIELFKAIAVWISNPTNPPQLEPLLPSTWWRKEIRGLKSIWRHTGRYAVSRIMPIFIAIFKSVFCKYPSRLDHDLLLPNLFRFISHSLIRSYIVQKLTKYKMTSKKTRGILHVIGFEVLTLVVISWDTRRYIPEDRNHHYACWPLSKPICH
jgi:hypothetical protein